ncbi:MAG: TonB-dependent receptor [Niabella sp.]
MKSCLFSLFVCFPFIVTAQQVYVQVTDSSTNQPLPGATLVLKIPGIALAQSFTCDARGEGHYTLPGSPGAEMTAEVSCRGYHTKKQVLHTGEINYIRLVPVVKQLDAVQVAGTGARAALEARRSVHNIKVMDAGQIRAQGAVNLTDLLASQMNVRVVNDNVNGASIMVQGLSGQNVKILLDGIPIIAGENNELDLNQLNLSNAARVEFVENAMAVQYGSNATAGVINIVTKTASGLKPVEGSVSTFYETVGKYNIDGLLGLRLRDSSRLSVTLGRNQFDGFSSERRPRSKIWNPSVQYSGNIRYTKPWKKLLLGLAHNQFFENQINKGDPDPGYLYRTTNDVEFITNRFNSVVSLSGELLPQLKIDLINSYQYYSRDNHEYLVNLTDETRKELEATDTRFNSYAFRGNANYRHGESRMAYLAGYDINLNRSKGSNIDPLGSSINDYGFYGGIGYYPSPSLYIQGALRWLHNSKFRANGINFLGLGLPVVPSLNIKYDIANVGTIRLAYTKSFRAPGLRELYWDFQDANHSINGNPGLKPEIADNITASATINWRRGQHNFGISPLLYYNYILEKIELVDKDRATMEPARQYVNVAMIYQNIARFRTYGGSLGFLYSYNNRFTIRPAIGLLMRSGSNSLNKVYQTPEANAAITYLNDWSNIRFSLFYKYNGRLSRFGLSRDGQLQDRSQGDYHLLDFSMARNFGRQWMATAGVKNIAGVTEVEQTSQGNTDGSNYSPRLPVGQGRQAFFRLTFQL